MKETEVARLNKLKEYEQTIYTSGIQLIAGVDEAGRGPLAGPVVVRNCHYAPLLFDRRSKRFQKSC